MTGRNARSVETRQRILDSACAVFTAKGFSQANLKDIAEHAFVTTGAFYYHFESKEAVAAALVDESWSKITGTVSTILGTRAPGLENVIVMTLAVMDMMSNDRSNWLAFDLDYRFGQGGGEGTFSYFDRFEIFSGQLTEALARTKLHEGITPQDASAVIVSNIYGLMTTALHGSALSPLADPVAPVRQLVQNWRILLSAIAPAEALPYYRQFLTRTAELYEQRAEAG